MKTKKTLTMIMAVALACVLSVAGTLAYLTATTDTVTNTFAAQGLIDDGNFVLKEHKAEAQTANPGVYELNLDEEVVANTYSVVPGVDLPKDPFVRVNNLKAKAYLFIEVKSDLPETLKFSIVDAWEATTLTGQNGGTVYTLKSGALDANSSLIQTILEGDKVFVEDDYAGSASKDLKFYGYLAQAAGFDNAAAAWTATFGA